MGVSRAAPLPRSEPKEVIVSHASVTVDQWVELFRAIGLEEETMHKWHVEFERRYPEGHQGFLEWLNLPAGRIAEIRKSSATP
jgi:hypothetical protein